jgi:hypothetical protein
MPDDDTFLRRLDDLSPTSDSPDLARNAIAPDEIGMSLGPRSKVQGGDADDDDADAEVRVPPTSDSPDLARNATTPNEISSFCTYAQCNYAQSIGMSLETELPRSKVQGGDADDDDDADAEVRVRRPDWRPAVQRPGSKVQGGDADDDDDADAEVGVQEVLMSYWSNQKKRRVCMPDDVDEVMTLDRSEPLPEVQGDDGDGADEVVTMVDDEDTPHGHKRRHSLCDEDLKMTDDRKVMIAIDEYARFSKQLDDCCH